MIKSNVWVQNKKSGNHMQLPTRRQQHRTVMTKIRNRICKFWTVGIGILELRLGFRGEVPANEMQMQFPRDVLSSCVCHCLSLSVVWMAAKCYWPQLALNNRRTNTLAHSNEAAKWPRRWAAVDRLKVGQCQLGAWKTVKLTAATTRVGYCGASASIEIKNQFLSQDQNPSKRSSELPHRTDTVPRKFMTVLSTVDYLRCIHYFKNKIIVNW